MKNLYDVRDNDLSLGVFDIYVDDVNLTNEQIVELCENDVVRLSEVNPYSVKNSEVFEKIKNATEFMKNVLDDVLGGQNYSVYINTFEGYVKKIIDCYKENPSVLNRINADKFKKNDMIEIFLNRELLARYNKFLRETENSKKHDDEYNEKVYKFQVENQKLQNIIAEKKAKKVFRNNLNIKPIE